MHWKIFVEMALQHALRFQDLFSLVKEYKFGVFPSAAGISFHSEAKRSSIEVSSCCFSPSNLLRVPCQVHFLPFVLNN